MEGVAELGEPFKVTDPVKAEELAAQARASKSLEERQQGFKDMLLERGVSERAGRLGAGSGGLNHFDHTHFQSM